MSAIKTILPELFRLHNVEARHFVIWIDLNYAEYENEEDWQTDVLDEQMMREAILDGWRALRKELDNNPIYCN